MTNDDTNGSVPDTSPSTPSDGELPQSPGNPEEMDQSGDVGGPSNTPGGSTPAQPGPTATTPSSTPPPIDPDPARPPPDDPVQPTDPAPSPLPPDAECAPSDCPEQQPLISRVCPDGSASQPSCTRQADGSCTWSAGECQEPLPDAGPAEPTPDELACESDSDCTACTVPALEDGQSCACPMCPDYPANVEACKARQLATQKCSAVILCPQVACLAVEVVTRCVEGQCTISNDGQVLR